MIAVTREDTVAVLTIDRPEAMNALDVDTLTELRDRISDLRADEAVRVIVLTGAGDRAFAAGADIKYMSALSVDEAKEWGGLGQEVGQLLETSSKATIAAVNGFALGGGCELAMACHVRVASEGARLGTPEVKLGIMCGYAGSQRLPRLVGKGRALELLLTGEMVDAQEALRIGLVNRVVPKDKLMAEAEALVRKMIANGPVSQRFTLEAVNSGLELPLAEAQYLEATLFGLICTTADMKEGTQAFLEKRPAKFTGK